MAAHRYWRILILANSSNVASISRLEFREHSGGTDLAAGQTPIYNGTWASPEALFDGSDSTFGYTAGTAPSRYYAYGIGVDFGSGNEKSIREVALRNRSDLAGQGAVNFPVQWSDDGSTWTTAWQCSDVDWATTGEVRVYPMTPLNRVVLDLAAPPTDSGPFAVALTPYGNATVTSGRFVFDGSGDYYQASGISPQIYRLVDKLTIEISQIRSAASGFKGIFCLGAGDRRLLLVDSNGALQLWEGGSARVSVGGVFSPTTPIDVKITLDGTALEVFVDGVSIGTGVFESAIYDAYLTLGTDTADQSGRSMDGSFGRVKITQGLGEPDGKHAKWRVKIDHVHDHGRNCVVASEIEFFGERGGPDLVPTQSGYTSQLLYGNDSYDNAWHAFDDNTGSIWHNSCATGGSDYIGWNFEEPTEVVGFSYRSRGGGYYGNDSIEDGGLEYYDELSASWVRLFSIPTQSTEFGNTERRSFFDAASAEPDEDGYRYWEVLGLHSNEGGYNGMSQVQMARATGGNIVNASYCSTQQGGSFQAGAVSELIQYDFIGIAQWYNGADGSQWFAVDFGEGNGKKVRHVSLYPNRDSVNRSWDHFEVAAWNNPDRSDRVLMGTFSTTWVAATYQTFDLDDYGTIAPVEMVGSASGTSTALGYYIVPGDTDGHATGTSTAIGRIMALGTIQMAGSAIALGSANAVPDTFRPTVGSSIGASTVTGSGAAVGTISGVGSAAGTSNADSGSAATGIMSVLGAGVATSNALGVGTGRQSYVGNAAGTSTADAGGSYAPTLSVGRANGTSTVVGIGSGTRALYGTATGRSEALGFLAGVRGMVGAATGQGSSSGITDQNRPGDGAGAATSSALGVGTGLNSAIGTATATSSAGASGTYAPTGAVGIATGGSTVLGRSTLVRASIGAANATSGAIARSNSLAPAAGSATGSSTSVGASRSMLPMRGSAGGASAGDGHSSTLGIGVGRSIGSSIATSGSVIIGHFAPGPRIVLVPPRPKTVIVPPAPPSSRVVVVAPRDKIVVVPRSNRAVSAA